MGVTDGEEPLPRATVARGKPTPGARRRRRSTGFGLGVAMFLPAVLYVLLLVGVPFGMAFFYAFSDARIGSGGDNFVGFENFSSILESASFKTALKNAFIFSICSQILVLVGSTALALALKDKFRGRGFVRFLI
ncbi:MAG TPA: hypothetical protein VGD80_22650, partial [Kofleriaceae bacterium]